MSSHSNVIQQSKEIQAKQLKYSSAYSKQLIDSIHTIIHNNSYNDEPSSLIDKISTIHELDREIDKQLNKGIAVSFSELMETRKKVERLIEKCKGVLETQRRTDAPQITGKELSIIDDFQNRSEKIDQELRILENTLKLIKK